MHMLIGALEKVATKYAPSRALSFDVVHIFKTLQLIENNGHVSRGLLCEELGLGEGSIKTLIKHLKMNNLIKTSNRGTKMTNRGKTIFSELISSIPTETVLPTCSIALGKFNHAVLLKELSYAVRSGIEQRDAAIRMGGIGATTLLFRENKFVMPGSGSRGQDTLRKEQNIRAILIDKLKPQEDDVIIIGSADIGRKTAELATKNAALFTLLNHEKHN
jgi:uncharacterized protein DUF4443/transcription factor-like protein